MAVPNSPESLESERLSDVRSALLGWFKEHQSDLPWRRNAGPYAVLVSEIMLQQTQRERVVPRFLEFIERFPTLDSLAAAPASAVIRAWRGLGYNGRALRLHRTAQSIVVEGGVFPRDAQALRRLPGIGRYTAGAIVCFSFGEQTSFVDTNVRRVLRRVFCGEPHPEPSPKHDEWLAASALPAGRAVEWNSALMDLGALICKAAVPRCEECPLRTDCLAGPAFTAGIVPTSGRSLVAEQGSTYQPLRQRPARSVVQPFKESDRYLRGRLVDALRGLPDGDTISFAALARTAAGIDRLPDMERIGRLLAALEKEGMLIVVETEGARRFRLPG